MEPIFIELCGMPQGKGRARVSRLSMTPYTPAKTRDYEANLQAQAFEVMAGRAPLEGPIECQVTAIFPIPKSFSKKKRAAALAGEIRPVVKPDWDNLAKVFDAFNHVVWRDDAQVVDGSVKKRYGERPGLQIYVGRAG